MRILFETNVILDALLAQDPQSTAAVLLMDVVARKELKALLGATTITSIYYTKRRDMSAPRRS